MNRREHVILFAVAIFGLIAVLATTSLDLMLAERMRELPGVLRRPLLHLTELGKSEYYLVPTLILFLVFMYRRQMQRAAIALYVFSCIAVSGLIVNLLKFVVGRARPKEWFENGAYGFDALTLESRWHSFPSGHANTMTAFVISLLPFIPAAWRAPLIIWAGAVMSTRAILSAHYLSDILGGVLVACLTCYVVENFVRQRFGRPFDPLSPA
ncbi:MAG: phosphatase PAP2 family protein [Bdellovibrionales bacterium]